MTDLKRCKVCGEIRPISEFYRAPGTRDGHRSDCKPCNLAAKHSRYLADPQAAIDRVQRWREGNPEKYLAYQAAYRASGKKKASDRKSHLKRKFGLSLEEYDEMLVSQGGRCAICRRKPRKISLHVDHDPESGRVRGLLCFSCNQALGSLQDDPDIVSSAVTYLIERDPEMERLGRIARERALALCS
jgi:hypothetical protein